MVASYRADDLHRRHPLRPLLGELVRLPEVERVELSPFTPRELRDYLRALSGEPVPEPLVRDVLARSEGNAYFAEELLAAGLGTDRTVGAALPTAWPTCCWPGWSGCPPRCSGSRGSPPSPAAGSRHPLLQAASGLSEAEVEEALREAVTHHVLVAEGGDRYAFRHALLQEAVLRRPAARRAGPAARDVRAVARRRRRGRRPGRPPSWPTTAWRATTWPAR